MHSAHRARKTVDHLRQEKPDFITPDLWHSNITALNPVDYKRSGLSCNIVSTRQKSVAWMNGGWSTSDVALNSWLSTWLLTTSVEESSSVHPFEFEHNLWTDDINFVSVCHFQCNFCMTVSPLPCYIFQSTSVPETSTIRPTRVFVLQGSAPAKSWYGGRFYSTLGRRYLLSECRKNY